MRKLESCGAPPPFIHLGPEPGDLIVVETVKKHSTLPSVSSVAHLVTCLSLPALSLGTGLLYICNGLWRVRGQNQGASLFSDHNIVLNPDAQATETRRCLVVVLADVQTCDKRSGEERKVENETTTLTEKLVQRLM